MKIAPICETYIKNKNKNILKELIYNFIQNLY
jgi:hypothetical protein